MTLEALNNSQLSLSNITDDVQPRVTNNSDFASTLNDMSTKIYSVATNNSQVSIEYFSPQYIYTVV